MSAITESEISEVFGRVEHWPTEAKRTLVELIRTSLERVPDAVPEKPKATFYDLVGLLKRDGPPPTDEEIAQMLHDELMRRYG